MFEHNKFETLAIPFNLARTHARTHTPYPAIQYKGKSSMQKVKMRSFVFLLFLGNLLRFRGQKEKDDNEMKLKRTRLERILCTCAGPFPPFFRLCDSDCSGVQMRWGWRHQFNWYTSPGLGIPHSCMYFQWPKSPYCNHPCWDYSIHFRCPLHCLQTNSKALQNAAWSLNVILITSAKAAL